MASTARLDELKKKFDENPRRYFAPLANEHRKSGDLDQAIALCRTHLPQQPAHISGHIVLAQALFEAGSRDESRDIFQTALGLDPENLIALRYLGDIARDADDVTTARGWYQRVLEVDPRNDEIVQLVRDLDAPRPVTAEESPVADEAAVDATPTATSAESAATTAADNPRFAPLSLEHIDFDAPAEAPPSQSVDAPGEQAAETSFDVHAAWSADSPTVELPVIDAPEIDSFDVDASASAESLFDAGSEQPQADPFTHELSDLSSPEYESQVDPEYSVGDAWSVAPEAEPPAASPAADATTFAEGSFDVGPPPEEPAEPTVAEGSLDAPAVDDAILTAAAAETATWEMPTVMAADASADVSEPGQHADQERSTTELVPPVVPNAEAPIDDYAATADWQETETQLPEPPDAIRESTADSAFGLEVMEFVPPSREVERTPDLVAGDHAEQTAPPAAFVTETMAELYLQQGFRNEALAVYRELLSRNPADSSLRDRIEQIEANSLSSIGMASVSEDVVESALRRQSARPTRSVRSFFASLAGRRAPVQPSRSGELLDPDVSAFAPVEDASAPPEADVPSEHLHVSVAPPAEQVSLGAERSRPINAAAETLADFDPFADPLDMGMPASDDTMDVAPNAEASAPVMPFAQDPETASPSEQARPRSSLEDLFPDAPVTPRSEAAAQTLATAFGRAEPQGRPTRAASSELSLDNVFRGAPEGAAPVDGGFSFDQFFSDALPEGGDVAAPTMSPPETGRSSGGGDDAHDIEQFTAWLEGLKKR